jgi:hypothetical protein
MGTSSSSSKSSQGDESRQFRELVDLEYQLVSTSFDERYGEVKIMKHSRSQDMIAVNTRVFNSEQSFRQTLERFRRNSMLQLDYIVNFLRYQEYTKEEFCGSFWKLQVNK